jgi:hypothetical protein
MTPDPLINKLARFTPTSATVDQAALLFAAGRASARTPWLWKVAVAGLLLTNLGWLSLLIFRQNITTGPTPNSQPEAVPVAIPQADPPPPATNSLPSSSDDPWSYRSLASIDDPEKIPLLEPLISHVPTQKPLTPRTAFRGEID